MKKNFFGMILVVAVALFAGYTAYNSHKVVKLSSVTLANLEALAGENDGSDGESGGSKHICYDRYSSADWFHKDEIFIWCQGCCQAKGHNLQDRNTCISKF